MKFLLFTPDDVAKWLGSSGDRGGCSGAVVPEPGIAGPDRMICRIQEAFPYE